MRFPNSEILISNHADQQKTLKNINKIARDESTHEFIKHAVKKYGLANDLESLRYIFNAAFRTATFQPDPEGHQYIRSVNRVLKDRRANCVDYTVFISAFLRAIGVDHLIRMVSFDPDNPKAYQHIYPMTLNGIALDVVHGQDPHGGESKKDPDDRRSYFNKQQPFINKFDKIIRV